MARPTPFSDSSDSRDPLADLWTPQFAASHDTFMNSGINSVDLAAAIPGALSGQSLYIAPHSTGSYSDMAAATTVPHASVEDIHTAFVAPHATLLGGGSGTTQDISPSMANETAYVSGIDATGHVVGTSFWTWNNDNPATYATRSNAHKWGAAQSDTLGGTVTYYFDSGSSWTATEKAQMTACITLWSDLANINFSLTTNSAAADITLTRGSDGQAVTPAGWSGTSSAGNVGGTNLWTLTSATVSIDTSVPGFGPMDGDFASIGGYVWMTIEHEMGHAIGLGHGGGYNGNVNSSTQQYSAFDSRLWTIMSYIDPDDTNAKYYSQYTVTGTSWGTAPDGYAYVPTTPMMLDIAAIQGLYGASTAAAYAGGQIFGFHSNITDVTKEFYDFTVNTNPVVTIWDAGTGNTLDLSGFSAASTINLNAGTFSSCNGEVNNIGIAAGTRIDTAIGGAGNDTFIANGDIDTLSGGAGNDVFNMGSHFNANDRLNGGGNTNTLILNGDYSAGIVFQSQTTLNIQKVQLTAGHSYLLTPADSSVAAGKIMQVDGHTLGAADRLTFVGSKETNGFYQLIGGACNDVLTGGQSNDTFNGGGGSDQMKGGGGADTFVYSHVADSTGTTHDTIVNFDFAIDKIDLWVTIAGVLPTINGGDLTTGSFDNELKAAMTSLSAHHAVLFNPSTGSYAGHTILVVDFNGIAGYQAGGDLVIDLHTPTNLADFSASTFI